MMFRLVVKYEKVFPQLCMVHLRDFFIVSSRKVECTKPTPNINFKYKEEQLSRVWRASHFACLLISLLSVGFVVQTAAMPASSIISSICLAILNKWQSSPKQLWIFTEPGNLQAEVRRPVSGSLPHVSQIGSVTLGIPSELGNAEQQSILNSQTGLRELFAAPTTSEIRVGSSPMVVGEITTSISFYSISWHHC